MLTLTRNERNLENWENEVLRSFFGNCFLDDCYSTRGIMATDVAETNDEVKLSINLPGFKKEDLNINFEEGYLTVKAENKERKEKKNDKKYILKERTNEVVSRTYYLGENIDTEDIKANFTDGVLEIQAKKVIKPVKNIVID